MSLGRQRQPGQSRLDPHVRIGRTEFVAINYTGNTNRTEFMYDG
jgi:hypothetical protein